MKTATSSIPPIRDNLNAKVKSLRETIGKNDAAAIKTETEEPRRRFMGGFRQAVPAECAPGRREPRRGSHDAAPTAITSTRLTTRMSTTRIRNSLSADNRPARRRATDPRAEPAERTNRNRGEGATGPLLFQV